MEYYIDGNEVSAPTAHAFFHKIHNYIEPTEINAMWAQCVQSEAARDEWFGSSLELVD